MAYINKATGRGPYPCDKDEYCGNFHPGFPVARSFHETQQEAEARRHEWLSKMRLGRPRPAGGKGSRQLAGEGWSGLYLKESRKLYRWERRVPTPDNLKEPGETRGDPQC